MFLVSRLVWERGQVWEKENRFSPPFEGRLPGKHLHFIINGRILSIRSGRCTRVLTRTWRRQGHLCGGDKTISMRSPAVCAPSVDHRGRGGPASTLPSVDHRVRETRLTSAPTRGPQGFVGPGHCVRRWRAWSLASSSGRGQISFLPPDSTITCPFSERRSGCSAVVCHFPEPLTVSSYIPVWREELLSQPRGRWAAFHLLGRFFCCDSVPPTPPARTLHFQEAGDSLPLTPDWALRFRDLTCDPLFLIASSCSGMCVESHLTLSPIWMASPTQWTRV